MLASEQREVSTATCRLQFVSGEVWTGPQRILRDPQFLCTVLFPGASRHKQFQRCKSSAAPWTGFGPRFPCPAPFYLPSLPEIQRRPRPSPNTRSLTNSHVAYILGIFLLRLQSSQCVKTYREEIINIKSRTRRMGVSTPISRRSEALGSWDGDGEKKVNGQGPATR